jgi:hypothetical protein
MNGVIGSACSSLLHLSLLPTSSLFSHVVSIILSSFPITAFCSLDSFCPWFLSLFSLNNIHKKDLRQFKINHTLIINNFFQISRVISQCGFVMLIYIVQALSFSGIPMWRQGAMRRDTSKKSCQHRSSGPSDSYLKITNGDVHITWTHIIPD